MTNEEKVREIINCGDWCESINKCDYKNTGVNCYAYGIAMRMAEWKDEQLKQQKEKLKEFENWLYHKQSDFKYEGMCEELVGLNAAIQKFEELGI